MDFLMKVQPHEMRLSDDASPSEKDLHRGYAHAIRSLWSAATILAWRIHEYSGPPNPEKPGVRLHALNPEALAKWHNRVRESLDEVNAAPDLPKDLPFELKNLLAVAIAAITVKSDVELLTHETALSEAAKAAEPLVKAMVGY
jgi:hypothetical protein